MLYTCLNIHTQCLYTYMQILVNNNITDLYNSFFVFNIHHMAIMFSHCCYFFHHSLSTETKSVFLVCVLPVGWHLDLKGRTIMCKSKYCQVLLGKKSIARLFYSRPWELLMSFLSCSKLWNKVISPKGPWVMLSEIVNNIYISLKMPKSQTWWHTTFVPALGRQKQISMIWGPIWAT